MINFEVYKENAEERLSYTSSDTPRTFIRALEDIVKLCEYGQKLKTENQTLQERVQKLEQQKNWLAKKCEELSDDVEDSFMPYHIPAETWVKRAEEATKE